MSSNATNQLTQLRTTSTYDAIIVSSSIIENSPPLVAAKYVIMLQYLYTIVYCCVYIQIIMHAKIVKAHGGKSHVIIF